MKFNFMLHIQRLRDIVARMVAVRRGVGMTGVRLRGIGDIPGELTNPSR